MKNRKERLQFIVDLLTGELDKSKKDFYQELKKFIKVEDGDFFYTLSKSKSSSKSKSYANFHKLQREALGLEIITPDNTLFVPTKFKIEKLQLLAQHSFSGLDAGNTLTKKQRSSDAIGAAIWQTLALRCPKFPDKFSLDDFSLNRDNDVLLLAKYILFGFKEASSQEKLNYLMESCYVMMAAYACFNKAKNLETCECIVDIISRLLLEAHSQFFAKNLTKEDLKTLKDKFESLQTELNISPQVVWAALIKNLNDEFLGQQLPLRLGNSPSISRKATNRNLIVLPENDTANNDNLLHIAITDFMSKITDLSTQLDFASVHEKALTPFHHETARPATSFIDSYSLRNIDIQNMDRIINQMERCISFSDTKFQDNFKSLKGFFDTCLSNFEKLREIHKNIKLKSRFEKTFQLPPIHMLDNHTKTINQLKTELTSIDNFKNRLEWIKTLLKYCSTVNNSKASIDKAIKESLDVEIKSYKENVDKRLVDFAGDDVKSPSSESLPELEKDNSQSNKKSLSRKLGKKVSGVFRKQVDNSGLFKELLNYLIEVSETFNHQKLAYDRFKSKCLSGFEIQERIQFDANVRAFLFDNEAYRKKLLTHLLIAFDRLSADEQKEMANEIQTNHQYRTLSIPLLLRLPVISGFNAMHKILSHSTEHTENAFLQYLVISTFILEGVEPNYLLDEKFLKIFPPLKERCEVLANYYKNRANADVDNTKLATIYENLSHDQRNPQNYLELAQHYKKVACDKVQFLRLQSSTTYKPQSPMEFEFAQIVLQWLIQGDNGKKVLRDVPFIGDDNSLLAARIIFIDLEMQRRSYTLQTKSDDQYHRLLSFISDIIDNTDNHDTIKQMLNAAEFFWKLRNEEASAGDEKSKIEIIIEIIKQVLSNSATETQLGTLEKQYRDLKLMPLNTDVLKKHFQRTEKVTKSESQTNPVSAKDAAKQDLTNTQQESKQQNADTKETVKKSSSHKSKSKEKHGRQHSHSRKHSRSERKPIDQKNQNEAVPVAVKTEEVTPKTTDIKTPDLQSPRLKKNDKSSAITYLSEKLRAADSTAETIIAAESLPPLKNQPELSNVAEVKPKDKNTNQQIYRKKLQAFLNKGKEEASVKKKFSFFGNWLKESTVKMLGGCLHLPRVGNTSALDNLMKDFQSFINNVDLNNLNKSQLSEIKLKATELRNRFNVYSTLFEERSSSVDKFKVYMEYINHLINLVHKEDSSQQKQDIVDLAEVMNNLRQMVEKNEKAWENSTQLKIIKDYLDQSDPKNVDCLFMIIRKVVRERLDDSFNNAVAKMSFFSIKKGRHSLLNELYSHLYNLDVDNHDDLVKFNEFLKASNNAAPSIKT